jgi:quinol monooxygenase YgiN
MTCQAILEITVKDGCYDELRKWLIKILPETRGFDGNVNVEFVRNQDDPSKLLMMEKWETREHYERYLAWRVEVGTIDELSTMIDGELQVRYFDFIGL